MEGAEIIVLPVVRVDRFSDDVVPDPQKNPVAVVDINAFRARRARAMAERRASRSLLPELGAP